MTAVSFACQAAPLNTVTVDTDTYGNVVLAHADGAAVALSTSDATAFAQAVTDAVAAINAGLANTSPEPGVQ